MLVIATDPITGVERAPGDLAESWGLLDAFAIFFLVAENLLNCEFLADKPNPNQKWLSDIICGATDEGDCYGRRFKTRAEVFLKLCQEKAGFIHLADARNLTCNRELGLEDNNNALSCQ